MDRLTVLETQQEEREANRIERWDELLRRLILLEDAVTGLSNRTQGHLRMATCLNAGKAAIQWGSMGGGLVAVVVLLGKLLGFW